MLDACHAAPHVASACHKSPYTATMGGPDPVAYRRALQGWYQEHGRHDLPWRETRDPYAVLVSEVMLQQTQVQRVMPYYLEWMQRWPDATALAAASPGDVIRAWAGLGYNRRALNLHRAAQAAVQSFGGRVPSTVSELKVLPGIGPYTAGAVACFAAGAVEPFADTNIARVVARSCLGSPTAKEASANAVTKAATRLLPDQNARDHNLALMDLGATVCTTRPACLLCPVAKECVWRAKGAPVTAPGAPRQSTPRFETTARYARGRILDLLRAGPAAKATLTDALPEAHAARIDTYLAALRTEGLIAETAGAWSLPGDPVSSNDQRREETTMPARGEVQPTESRDER